MKVKQLKELLSNFSDDLEVLIIDHKNIEAVEIDAVRGAVGNGTGVFFVHVDINKAED